MKKNVINSIKMSQIFIKIGEKFDNKVKTTFKRINNLVKILQAYS